MVFNSLKRRVGRFGRAILSFPTPGHARLPRERTGHFDGVDNFHARGWAIDPKLWPAPLQVEILVENVVIARGVSDQERPELAAIGLPSRAGFSIGLPRFLAPETVATINVRFADTKEPLEGSAKQNTVLRPLPESHSLDDKVALAKGLLTSISGESAFLAAAPRKIAVYAIHNELALPSKSHLAMLRELRENNYSIVIVNSVPTAADQLLDALVPVADLVVHRKAGGRDFGSWFAISLVYGAHLSRAEEILFVNDSLIGPVKPIAQALARRDKGGVPDFWGLSDSQQITYHIQSSIFSTSGALFGSDVFRGCLVQYPFTDEKDKVIVCGELALTSHMLAGGVRPSVLCPYDELAANWAAKAEEWKARIARGQRGTRHFGESELGPARSTAEIQRQLRWIDGIASAVARGSPHNPQHFFWDEMIERYDYPFIKRELVVDNPERIPTINYLDSVMTFAQAAQAFELIDDEISRRPTAA